jgi:hypothetical protein
VAHGSLWSAGFLAEDKPLRQVGVESDKITGNDRLAGLRPVGYHLLRATADKVARMTLPAL